MKIDNLLALTILLTSCSSNSEINSLPILKSAIQKEDIKNENR